mmetsp:Transcript_69696/g.123370  ORF Transcript_69696/g.123370 Transcript_69696/m.123370 type:complete len:474 (-) Transcript_69696:68-1489(-)|eukprot:CAMPEP_0197639548 /NCGR_PEP_ID=MMETSP1338-20131121/14141_1 /TAXON_ID=43686 ORGANISM="Pelagodinium beii, Strain RCC1491" /NCGR_SAMPLE_ID=MMETSP1338 /ASSEMBLY_ACC=CAM_ASM_000754 /LENGTH=473 /DNA_ID=CAMNT_0043212291 /DNA_START=144 /DNA_END=1565 /DNA_ORIENTATION=+
MHKVTVTTHAHKSYSSYLSEATNEKLEYGIATIYLLASVLFVVGSFHFLPDGDEKMGCRLFDVASIFFFVMSLFNAAELGCRPSEQPIEVEDARVGSGARVLSDEAAVSRQIKASGLEAKMELYVSMAGKWADILEQDASNPRVRCKVEQHTLWLPVKMLTRSRPWPKGREILEQSLYVLGSFIFTCGTIIWDPDLEFFFSSAYTPHSRSWWLAVADGLFMAGSLMFALAAYINALGIYESHFNTVLRRYALAIATCYEFGGFCFIAGTMGFAPYELVGCNSKMIALGAVCYIIGSFLYLIGSALSLFKCIVQNQMAREHVEKIIMLQKWTRRKVEQKRRQEEELPDQKYFAKTKQIAASIQRRFAERRMERVSEQVKSTLRNLVAELREKQQSSDSEDLNDEVSQKIASRVLETLVEEDEDLHSDLQRMTSDWGKLQPLFAEDEEPEDEIETFGFWPLLNRALNRAVGDKDK